MKILQITLKDLTRNLRSLFVLAFMFVLPLLQAGLPYLAFHGFSRELEVQVTRVQIVNLDRPVAEYPDFKAGTLLFEMFQDKALAKLLTTTLVESEAGAYAALENRATDVVLVIPADFTATLFQDSARVTLKIEHDPVLNLGPAIVRDVVTNFTDGFAGSLMAADVLAAQSAAHGQALSAAARLNVMRGYGDWAQTIGQSLSRGVHPAIRYEAFAGTPTTRPVMEAMIGPLMAGMLVFFAFFVGAIAAQSILREEEQGTLARLLATPTSQNAILTAKFLAVVLLIGLQAAILIGLSSLLFGIDWGAPLAVLANGLALALAAGGFGVMLISFLHTTRQAFLVLGGVVILTGMAGGTMTTTFSGLPPVYGMINLLTPQGWVIRGLTATLQGGAPAEILLPALVAMGLGLTCFGLGLFNFKRRV